MQGIRVKALVKHANGPNGLSLQDVGVPEIGADDVLVEVKAAAVCGTDLHIWDDTYPVDMPVTIGHEFSGVIVESGRNVLDWKAGDRVIAEGNMESCGICFSCTGGNANYCRDNKYLGIRVDGVFAHYARIPARLLHEVPGNLTFEEAALAEPAAVAIDALLVKNSLKAGDFVVIQGCGPIGLLAGQIAKAAGAGSVMITGRDSAVRNRFKVAGQLGCFDHIVNVSKVDPVEIVRDATGGRGADIILDTTGSSVALQQAVDMVRRGGVIEVIGISDDVVELPVNRLVRDVIRIHFCRGTTRESFSRFCSLAADGKLNLEPIISHRFSLEDWQKGFAAAEGRESVKTLLVP